MMEDLYIEHLGESQQLKRTILARLMKIKEAGSYISIRARYGTITDLRG